MTDIFYKANLKCPICDGVLMLEDQKTLYCNGQKKHAYDLSSSGYVNLSSPKQCGGGDTKEAVRARSAFLDAGYYKPISDKILELLKRYGNGGERVVDAGCGEGYYTVQAAKNGFFTLGFDISKSAVEAAAKRARRDSIKNGVYGVASIYSLPIFDACADAVINIFAPCVEAEFSRVLAKGGVLVVAWAGKSHLMGLKSAIYEETQENDIRNDLPRELELLCEERLEYDITLTDNAKIRSLFAMTPYYWRTSQKDAEKLDKLEELKTNIDINFSVYRKN